MNTKIITKIQNLLQLAKSSNENEAKSAMLLAQKLLMKHKLSMKEVEEADVEEVVVIEEHGTGCTYTRATWKGALANIIADNFGCYTFVRKYYSKEVYFLGKDDDIQVCNIVFKYALEVIKIEANKFKNKYKKEGKSTTGVENTYAVAFIKGLMDAFEEQKSQHKEWGLVLVKDIRVTEAYENMNLKEGKRPKALSTLSDAEIYKKAYEEGKSFSISDRIANEAEEAETRLLEQKEMEL